MAAYSLLRSPSTVSSELTKAFQLHRLSWQQRKHIACRPVILSFCIAYPGLAWAWAQYNCTLNLVPKSLACEMQGDDLVAKTTRPQLEHRQSKYLLPHCLVMWIVHLCDHFKTSCLCLPTEDFTVALLPMVTSPGHVTYMFSPFQLWQRGLQDQ